MELKARERRTRAVTIRIRESVFQKMDGLSERLKLSQADLLEALVEQEWNVAQALGKAKKRRSSKRK